MSKSTVRTLGILLGIAVLTSLAGLAILRSPELRTRTFFDIKRHWQAHWPLERGFKFPVRLLPFFEPLVPVQVEVEPGVHMLLDPGDLVSRFILENRSWEPDTWRSLREQLPRGGTFVDVGAHIGYFSLKAAQEVGPAGRVIAIEPNPETVLQLRANILASGSQIINVRDVACSDTETALELFGAARDNTGMSSLSEATASTPGSIKRTYRVRARPLDAILIDAGVSTVDAIKVDVEGAELLVLKGAKQTLVRHSPVLVVEMIEVQLQAMKTSSREIRDLLRSLGYHLQQQNESNLVFAK